ncbi:hypothetical protein HHI36_007856 [Cryptolaemus montrouzieri]|uniref:Uncharacterized protein n=1 Tax=Cryptolaemus montrouzieri TaxID=559131 RepID=A0ABD2MQW1_9CUCU
MVSIYVNRIEASSTIDSINDQLKDNGLTQFQVKLGYSKHPELYKPYIISALTDVAEKIEQADLWPEGVNTCVIDDNVNSNSKSRVTFCDILIEDKLVSDPAVVSNHFNEYLVGLAAGNLDRVEIGDDLKKDLPLTEVYPINYVLSPVFESELLRS